MSAPLLVICGLQREARCVQASGPVHIVVSSADCALLRERLAALGARAFCGVVSFGLAGGLDPALEPGDVAVGARAIAPGAVYDCAPAWRAALAQAFAAHGLKAAQGVVAGVEAAVMSAQDKAALRTRSRALVCDMESHIAGDFAACRRIPFAIVRAVSDPAQRALPPLAADAVKPDGKVNNLRVMARLARAPAQLPALMEAARDSRAAFASLGRCGGLLAGALGGFVGADL
ncbi:MAG: phosphorylase [Hyphomicrobiales bacterium]|nr:phosphorylase [Hyphomicrobiales bacterium]